MIFLAFQRRHWRLELLINARCAPTYSKPAACSLSKVTSMSFRSPSARSRVPQNSCAWSQQLSLVVPQEGYHPEGEHALSCVIERSGEGDVGRTGWTLAYRSSMLNGSSFRCFKTSLEIVDLAAMHCVRILRIAAVGILWSASGNELPLTQWLAPHRLQPPAKPLPRDRSSIFNSGSFLASSPAYRAATSKNPICPIP